MENPKNLYNGEPEWIEVVDPDGPIEAAAAHHPEEYDGLYFSAAKIYKDAGELPKEAVYRFLGELCGIQPTLHNLDEPFGPRWSGPDGRSCKPSDLSESDCAAIQSICKRSGHAALTARLLDFLFVRQKDFKAGHQAMALYVESAKGLLGTKHDWAILSAMKRALQIAKLTGRRSKAATRLAQDCIDIIKEAVVSERDPLFCWGVELLNEFGLGDPSDFIEPMGAKALAFVGDGNEDRARAYYEVLVILHRRRSDRESEEASLRDIGNSYVRSAERRAAPPASSNMAAASILKDGIEALRQGKESDARILKLRALLRKYQEGIGDEMQSYSMPMDLTHQARVAKEHLQGQSFFEGILRLALGLPLTNVTSLREEVLKAAKADPFFFMLDATVIDPKGRTREIQPGVHNRKGDDFEKALEQRMFVQMAREGWLKRAAGFIEPAREQFTSEHIPQLREMALFVLHNPVVPPGHEGIFARGLLAGLYGDFLVATHLLVPQFENSLRHLLDSNGIGVANLMSDGTEPLRLLGALLGAQETRDLLGEDFCFELRGILADESGYNFRHRLAHGMASEGECYGPAGLNAWWLMLRLCLAPMLPRALSRGAYE